MSDHKIQISQKGSPKNDDELYMPDDFRPEFQKTLDSLKQSAKWTELVDYLTPLSKIYTEEYFIMTELANAHYCLENAKEALVYADKAEEIERHDIIVQEAKGMALLLNDRFVEAMEYFNKILRKDI